MSYIRSQYHHLRTRRHQMPTSYDLGSVGNPGYRGALNPVIASRIPARAGISVNRPRPSQMPTVQEVMTAGERMPDPAEVARSAATDPELEAAILNNPAYAQNPAYAAAIEAEKSRLAAGGGSGIAGTISKYKWWIAGALVGGVILLKRRR